MSQSQTSFTQLGPRPRMTLVICEGCVAEIWVNGRAPLITIRDYDWGETDRDPCFDRDDIAFTKINWRAPAWALSLSLHSPEKEIPMAEPTLKHIPLSELQVSKLNMRHGRKKPDISDILPSIRQSGVRQTLLVRREGDHYGVIAGRRRFFALQEISKESGKVPLVPCAIMTEDDAATAIEASVIENVGRLPATEMEQYTAFKRLNDKGRSADEIAVYFGVTELTVRRVMALASLSVPIRKLYSDGEIDRETIRALTLATPDQQTEWLTLYKDPIERAPYGRQCKAWITGGVTITTDKALFNLEAFDGAVTTDLFGEHAVFCDTDAFWKAQSTAIAARIDTYIKNGWRDAQCLERGAYFASWEYEKRTKKDGGKVYIEVRNDGLVTFNEGYVTKAEGRKLDREERGEQSEVNVAIRPEMSGPVVDYVNLHRHGAARASLLKSPSIALRLMVAHALVGSDLWQVRPHRIVSRKEATEASISGSKARTEFVAAEAKIAELFATLGVENIANRNGDDHRMCACFSALLAMSDEEVMQVLSFQMAKTLDSGGAVVEAVLHVCEADLCDYWQPDTGFFDLLRDKRVINAMVKEIGGKSLADGCMTETASAQKDILKNRINGDGCKARPDWRPRWMQTSAKRYVKGAASAPFDAWSSVKSLFETERPTTRDVDAQTKTREAA